jgi:formate dehydrogenase subunit beta
MREIAAEWLADGTVRSFIGFRRRQDGAALPVRIVDPAEVQGLVFGDGCLHNLVTYIPRDFEGRIGILLKGCDGRALVQMAAEGELDRSRISVIGVVCPGLRDGADIAEKCRLCGDNNPPDCDELLTPEGAAAWDKPPDDEELEGVRTMPRADRMRFFASHFDSCIRCYACRDVCPMCYCRECIVEKSTPQWVEVTVKPSSNAYWNLIRAYHLAGRCVDCGECDRACPAGIPLRLLNREMARVAKELFDYRAGTSAAEKPPLMDFREDENSLPHGQGGGK